MRYRRRVASTNPWRRFAWRFVHSCVRNGGFCDIAEGATGHTIPAPARNENQLTVANGDFVLLHGHFSGLGEGVPSWVVVDIVRMENGVLAEHWDVIEDEATRAQSKSGNPMFGNEFPA
jgi:hypothetical protein